MFLGNKNLLTQWKFFLQKLLSEAKQQRIFFPRLNQIYKDKKHSQLLKKLWFFFGLFVFSGKPKRENYYHVWMGRRNNQENRTAGKVMGQSATTSEMWSFSQNSPNLELRSHSSFSRADIYILHSPCRVTALDYCISSVLPSINISVADQILAVRCQGDITCRQKYPVISWKTFLFL